MTQLEFNSMTLCLESDTAAHELNWITNLHVYT